MRRTRAIGLFLRCLGGNHNDRDDQGSCAALSYMMPSDPGPKTNQPRTEVKWESRWGRDNTFLPESMEEQVFQASWRHSGPVASSGQWKKGRSDACLLQVWPLRPCVTLYSLCLPICRHMWKREGTRTDSEDPEDGGGARQKEPGSLNDLMEHSPVIPARFGSCWFQQLAYPD